MPRPLRMSHSPDRGCRIVQIKNMGSTKLLHLFLRDAGWCWVGDFQQGILIATSFKELRVLVRCMDTLMSV